MPRGKVPGIYYTDGGTPYRYNVDADRYAVASFGWTDGAAERTHIPTGFKPRHVTGISATSGRSATAVVPDVSAGVWTGATNDFDVETSDSSLDTMTIVSRIGEKPSLP